MRKIFIIFVILLLSFSLNAHSDTVYLKSGGCLKGDIIAENEDEITLRTEISTFTLKRGDIDRIDNDKPAPTVTQTEPKVEPEPVETSASITQAEVSDFDEISNLKLPEQSAKVAEIINSHYYGYADKNIDIIQCRLSDTLTEEAIKKMKEKNKLTFAAELQKMQVIRCL